MAVVVRPLEYGDLSQADRIFRLAFGTAAGLPNPLDMFGDAGYMHRWSLATGQAFGAEVDGRLVGTNFLTQWGSLGSFGPLTVHPDHWNQGIASTLMEVTLNQFATWQTPTVAFFTSSHSPKHLWFYGKFGFTPGHLTTVLAKSIRALKPTKKVLFSALSSEQRSEVLKATQTLTDAVYAGLDVSAEVQLVNQQRLGDTVLLWEDGGLSSFAVCHHGPGSEGGSGQGYIKFGAAHPGPTQWQRFEQLLDACEDYCLEQGLSTLLAGVNTSRYDAYQRMLSRGFKIRLIGVAMHQAPEQDYCRPDAYVLDDRR